MVADSLQAQQAALSTAVARLLFANNESEEAAATQVNEIYNKVERNVYIFMGAMLAVIAGIGLGAAHSNRRLFDRVAALSDAFRAAAPQAELVSCNTFAEAQAWLDRNLAAHDAVLIENDLPDLYERPLRL